MKIVSSFRDYYDKVRGVDRDDEPLYVRATVVHELTFPWAARRSPEHQAIADAVMPLWTEDTVPPTPPSGEAAVLGFCGRPIPLYLVVEGTKTRGVVTTEQVHRTFKLDAKEEGPAARPRRRRYYGGGGPRPLSRTAWRDHQARLPRSVGDAPFRFFRAPVLLVTGRRVVVNPLLAALNIAALLDPPSAWQELSVYPGNNLVERPPDPRPISDALRAETKGFDTRSFRKHKDRKKLDRGEW